MAGWNGESEKIKSVSVNELDTYCKQDNLIIMDVREAGETEKFSIDHSLKIPLSLLQKNIQQLDKNTSYLLCCAGGYRSMIACSLLRKNGFNSVLNLKEGINAYAELKK
jgi:rhodanese-related sulfurtransferase